MEFYLAPLIKACRISERTARDSALHQWESGAPRPVQRAHVLRTDWSEESERFANFILFGKISGTGKTTTALEYLWRDVVFVDRGGLTSMRILRDEAKLPLCLSGHSLARTVAGQARRLDELMDKLIAPDILLIDDLDKRGDQNGKFSSIVQQTIFELVESRTSDPYRRTILTLNSNGDGLRAKFDDDIADYLMRRVKERFESFDFDIPAHQPPANPNATPTP